MNQINMLWSFSSIETSISEICAIKNCYFLALIFVEWSEKLSEKTACDVNVGQVKKSGKFKTDFFESTWCRSGFYGHKSGKNRQFVFKSCKLCGYNLLITEEYIIVKRTLTTFTNSLELYWKCGCVSPMFFKMHSQNVLI